MPSSAKLRAFEIACTAASFLLIVAVCVMPLAESLAAVFGPDDRTNLSPADTPLKDKIGTLAASDTGAFCTAFCVAPGIIATASHCLFGTAISAGPKLKRLTFKLASAPKSEPGTKLAFQSADQADAMISGTTRLAVVPPIGAARDWALAKLEAPACKSGGLHMSDRTVDDMKAAAHNGEVFQIAVHADLPDGKLHRGAPCDVHDVFPGADRASIDRDFASPEAILFHTCDTGGGSSGSPLLIDTPARPEVIAINVGTYVLSRAITTAQDTHAQTVSEPIANTAIEISAVRRALERLKTPD